MGDDDMLKYALKRIVKALITIFFILTLVFFFTRMSGDPTDWILPDDATEEQRVEMRHSLGLDRPLHEQYIEVMTSLFTGNAGRSYNYMRPVSELYAERIGATVRLGLISFGLAAVAGVTLGTIAAVKRNSFFDRFTIMLSIAGSTLPNFVLGILLVFLFCFVLRLLPSGGAESASSYIMPVIAMAVGPMANIARLTRTSLLDVLRQDYLDSARAKGVPERMVLIKHALRNALIPVITVIGLQVGTLVGGSVVVETVFSWPGIGSLLINGAKMRDYPIVIYGVMLISVAVTVMNTLVDLSYSFLDPRIRDNA